MLKKIKNNFHYFNISKENPEDPIDEAYCFFEINKDIKKYTEHIKKLKELLITIKTITNNKKTKLNTDELFINLQDLLTLNNYSNSSEFGCFINACDSTLDNARKDTELLKQITYKYFEKRIVNDIVPEEWIQAVLDSNSSRKKSKNGEKKIANILNENNFNLVKNISDFKKTKRCYAFCETKSDFSTAKLRLNLKLKINTKKQNKNLDVIFKCGKNIFILEAKHLNTNGGGQDKQISELIEILSLKEKDKNIHYISFLDGVYSNILLNNTKYKGKTSTQIKQMNKYLQNNKNNFWVNTIGFQKLIRDLE